MFFNSTMPFPPQLSKEEEKKYLVMLLDSCEERRNCAKQTLVAHNLRLVAHIVKKYRTNDSEDLISVGTIGLMKAVEAFDPLKEIRLSTYAARCIENAIFT